MKKLALLALAIAALVVGCGSKSENFYGTWTGEAMTFEVTSEGGNKVKISNENGSLMGEIKNGKIVGKNDLNMDFQMVVRGDSAFYTFAEIMTTYVRVK